MLDFNAYIYICIIYIYYIYIHINIYVHYIYMYIYVCIYNIYIHYIYIHINGTDEPFARQQWRHRCRSQTCGGSGGRREQDELAE